MNFSFSIRDFLNDFAIGFIFAFGIILTNILQFDWLLNSIQEYKIFVFIILYIIGILISSIGYFIDIYLYSVIDIVIEKIEIRFLNKILHFIKYITIHLFFRRWTVVETFIRLEKKGKLPKEISSLKSYNEFSILADSLSENLINYSKIFFINHNFL